MSKFSKALLLTILFVVVFILGIYTSKFLGTSDEIFINKITNKVDNYPNLSIYSIESLSKAQIEPGMFVSVDETDEKSDYYKSYIFTFKFDPNLDGKDLKVTTGLMRIPSELSMEDTSIDESEKGYPLIVMFRGYIDENLYQTGDGTKNASAYFAKNGYITIAPDFLGYAGSDENSANIFESRFQTYTTAITLLKTIGQPTFIKAVNGKWNGKDVFLWGHSNGGQVTLTTLEATGYSTPTTLWAPVTKPFPYSILFYTDDSDDGGKFIRSELAQFEKRYDADKYSLTNYLDKINAPIQLHQGTADTLVPISWSNEFVGRLKENDIDISYLKYTNADHNLQPNWSEVVKRDLEFFNNHRK